MDRTFHLTSFYELPLWGGPMCALDHIIVFSRLIYNQVIFINSFLSIHFINFFSKNYSIHFRTHIKQTLQIFTTLVVRRRNPPFSACMHPAIKKSLTRVKTTTKICLQILLNSVEIITWRCAWGPWLRKIASSCTQFSTLDASCS